MLAELIPPHFTSACVEILSQGSFLGASAVKCGAALAICHFNDGVSSFYSLAKSLGCEPTSAALNVLVGRDRRRIARSVYKESERAKCLRKLCQKRRKGLDDQKMEEEGPMYMTGMDGIEQPSKRKKRKKRKK